ncbi:gephyrin-like molybdotransferase Glp [Propionibacteriaceae bacterium Y1923]|uniref:molybdopterin molybdotransferase MoeA n=1 Tax=Aestuariimicrobium sp. Y1814 TaxID=3418742 RepID=UPI003C161503
MRLFGRKKPVEEPVVEAPRPTLPPGPEVGPDGLRSLADHRNYLLSLVEPLTPFGMQLLDADGLAICEEIIAPAPLPRASTAAADGYAVRAADFTDDFADGEWPLLQVVESVEGTLPENAGLWVEEHQVLPDGADTVMVESMTEAVAPDPEGIGGTQLEVTRRVQVGSHVRAAGSDVADGQVLVPHGVSLDPRLLGLLAAAGIDKVLARPRPRIVVISTGRGLVEPGRPLPSHRHVHDANGYMLAAAAKAEGCQVWRIGVVSEDLDEVRETISDQLIRADLVISTGGFREEDGDLLSEVVPSLGAADFAEVNIVPGRQQGFALIGEDKVPMVMLPGDPFGAYVSYHAFVQPLIRKLMGTEPVVRPPVRAITRSVIRSLPGVHEFARATLTTDRGTRSVEVSPRREQANLADLANINALVVLDESVEAVQAGQQVQVVEF